MEIATGSIGGNGKGCQITVCPNCLYYLTNKWSGIKILKNEAVVKVFLKWEITKNEPILVSNKRTDIFLDSWFNFNSIIVKLLVKYFEYMFLFFSDLGCSSDERKENHCQCTSTKSNICQILSGWVWKY